MLAVGEIPAADRAELGALARSVADGNDPILKNRGDHADPAGGCGIEVVSKGTGQIDCLNFVDADAQMFGQKLDAGTNGALCQLHLPDILLCQCDAWAELIVPSCQIP